MKILVTGGAGYKGSILIPKLIEDGHHIICVDTFWFGDYLEKNPSLVKLKADIRDAVAFEKAVNGIDSVIHLACISNDPSFALNENLCKTEGT